MVSLSLRFLFGLAAAIPLAVTATAPQAGSVVPNSYIVMLKPEATTDQLAEHQAWATYIHNSRLTRRDDSLTGTKFTYDMPTLKGYSVETSADAIEQIRARPEVAWVEQDRVVTVNSIIEQDAVPSWGLARISQTTSDYDADTYYYDESAGEGITAYVLDTGININHVDFEGRASWGISYYEDFDGFGHGTHCAGIIAGKTYGVAKKAHVVAVKVISNSGSGRGSDVIAGINYVVNTTQAAGTSAKSLISMSLGVTPSSQAVDAAAQAAIDVGIAAFASSGNDAIDTSAQSPSDLPDIITVGALNSNGSHAWYSDFGPLVDILAPGTDITSAWIGSNTSFATDSGTSMACPHVAGASAYLMALEGISGNSAIRARLVELSKDSITASDVPANTTSAVLYNGSGH